MKEKIARFASAQMHLFLLLCVVFIPFPFHIFSFQESLSNFCFKGITTFLSEKIFGIGVAYPEISSDSILLYMLVMALLIVSLLGAALLSFSAWWNKNRSAFFSLTRRILSYYLALQLLNYGLDKIVKTQFYLPEPNILYTPFGNLDKDILFWSTMGTSHLYNVLTGSIEVMAGLFLLFKRLRTAGLLLAFGILLNVVIINFGFDISVKIYCVFLATLSLFLLGPHLKELYVFFIERKSGQLPAEPGTFLLLERPFVKIVLRSFVICLVALEIFYSQSNAGEERTSTRLFHGAYEIINGRDSIAAGDISVKRFFIHRDGYLIFQTDKDDMIDFKLMINTVTNQFILIDYNLKERRCRYSYNEKERLIELQNPFTDKQQMLRAKTIDWKKLPALQDHFHWTIENL